MSWLKLLLGVLLLVVAVRQFRARPHQGEQITLPKWMGAIDRVKPGQALGGAVILSVLCLVIGMNLLGDALSRLSS